MCYRVSECARDLMHLRYSRERVTVTHRERLMGILASFTFLRNLPSSPLNPDSQVVQDDILGRTHQPPLPLNPL